MKINNITIIFFVSLFACSCKMTPDQYKKSQINFGSSGGFSNIAAKYHLLENGRLYQKRNTDTTFTELNKQNSESVKLIFAKTNHLFDETKELHEPGNKYIFIKIKHDSTSKELVWGASKDSSLARAKELYKELMNLVNLK